MPEIFSLTFMMEIICHCNDRYCDCYRKSGHGQSGLAQLTLILQDGIVLNDLIRLIEHFEHNGITPTSAYERNKLFVHVGSNAILQCNPGVYILLPEDTMIGVHDELYFSGYETLSQFLDAQFQVE